MDSTLFRQIRSALSVGAFYSVSDDFLCFSKCPFFRVYGGFLHFLLLHAKFTLTPVQPICEIRLADRLYFNGDRQGTTHCVKVALNFEEARVGRFPKSLRTNKGGFFFELQI